MKDYFNNTNQDKNHTSKEYNEFLALNKLLENNDFSKNSNKKHVFNKVLKNLNEHKGDNIMKKSNKIKRSAIAAAAVCVLSISIAQSSYAQNFVEKIINQASLGHFTAVQMETPKGEFEVPDKLKGKLFDKSHNPITKLSKDTPKVLYTADGEEIASFSNDEFITVSEEEKMEKENMLIVKDPSKLNNYTCFNVILPSYMPEGYSFNRADFYKDKNGKVSKDSKYIDIYFKNTKTGKCLYMQQRFACKETASSLSTDGKIEKIKINGVDAILEGDRSLDWETNGVMYFLGGKGQISKDELIKIAESVK